MENLWPVLSYHEAKATYETLHLFTQIAGKIRLQKMPWINHSWHVTLYVTPTGLSTSTITDGDVHFQINFNFLEHRLEVDTNSGEKHFIKLEGLSVAACYEKLMDNLTKINCQTKINVIPNELVGPIPLNEDTSHTTYESKHVIALHKALLKIHEIFTLFRSRFIGKCSPVHFFWGSFDLAVSRFSGKKAPLHPGGVPNLPDWVAQEAYSHEVCSCGFWPGSEAFPMASFYCYIYPEPSGLKDAKIKPEQAYYSNELREFILPYDVVQKSANPSATLLDFLQSTYEAAANLAKWDRKGLEQDL